MARYLNFDERNRTSTSTVEHENNIHYILEPDVVEVIRCKYCANRKKNKFCLVNMRYEKDDNGFCSHAERRYKETINNLKQHCEWVSLDDLLKEQKGVKMTYNGTNESAIDILKLAGIDRIKSFSKYEDGDLVIWYWYPDKKHAARYHITPGDEVFTSVSGMLRIVYTE